MPLRNRPDESLGINMTPMVDVLFTLLIFFMVGTKFTEDQRKLDVKLPTVGAAAASEGGPRKRTIAIDADGSIRLDGERIILTQLTERLKSGMASSGQDRIEIQGDAAVPFQGVANVLSATRAAGIHDMAIAVRVESVRH